MGNDPFRTHPPAAAQPSAADHFPEKQEPKPRNEQGDRGFIVRPPHEASAFSSAHFGSGLEKSGRFTAIANWIQRGRCIWRGHLDRDQLTEATRGSRGNVERWLLALLSVLVVVSCVYAAIVSTQVKSLKTEIATLQREIIALKLHVTRLDQIASANEARDKPGVKHPSRRRKVVLSRLRSTCRAKRFSWSETISSLPRLWAPESRSRSAIPSWEGPAPFLLRLQIRCESCSARDLTSATASLSSP